MHTPKVNYKLSLIVSLVLLAFGVGFGFIAFPGILRDIIKANVNVGKGSEVRPFYEKTPMLNFRINVFNVTNKNEVIQGRKPRLQEIGPYFFEEWKEKYNLVDNEENDTLTYRFKNTYIFRPDLSGPGLTGDEIVVMPHPIIAGVLLAANIDKQVMLPRLENALKNIFHNPTDAFYTGRVMDILFNGIVADCSSKEPFTGAICSNLEEQPQSVRRIDKDHLNFSFFGNRNGTDLGEIKVLRGVKNYKDMAHVIQVNGEDESDLYGDGDDVECNKFVGTDNTILRPLLNPEEGDRIWAYDTQICRSMGVSYANEQTTYSGLTAHTFELDINEDINAKKCYCRSEKSCPPKGTFDLYRCTGVPMYGSLPHFYKAEHLLKGIESGLNPNKKDHAVVANVEILTGTPLTFAKRLQFNLEMKPIPNIEWMKTMPNVIFPMFWAEESVCLDKEMTDQLKNSVFLLINIVDFLKWLCTIVGAIGSIGFAAILLSSRTSASMELKS